jgi:glutamine---fructose-6-phosphate transaminase (isomerizing)
MDDRSSWMAREIAFVPEVVARQEKVAMLPLGDLVARLRQSPPQLVVTCARGSSAHAATFGKHLIERHIGIPVCAAAPSIASVYARQLRLRGHLVLAISQSGKSDDLIAFAASARASGALTVAITNDEASPLAATCELTVPISAGSEVGIAATKTFVATLCVLLRLTAAWAGEALLESAVRRLPQRLSQATALDWTSAVEAFAEAASLTTIGRGPTLAIAREAALKLKETCSLHAEAFSGAEFLHGPVALVSARYPVLLFMPSDAAFAGMRDLAAQLIGKEALLFLAGPGPDAQYRLPALATDQPEADAVCLIQSFYSMLVRLAERRGCDADRPPNLQKITRTT